MTAEVCEGRVGEAWRRGKEGGEEVGGPEAEAAPAQHGRPPAGLRGPDQVGGSDSGAPKASSVELSRAKQSSIKLNRAQ